MMFGFKKKSKDAKQPKEDKKRKKEKANEKSAKCTREDLDRLAVLQRQVLGPPPASSKQPRPFLALPIEVDTISNSDTLSIVSTPSASQTSLNQSCAVSLMSGIGGDDAIVAGGGGTANLVFPSYTAATTGAGADHQTCVEDDRCDAVAAEEVIAVREAGDNLRDSPPLAKTTRHIHGLCLPDCSPAVAIDEVLLTLRRNPSGDFGFVLRRGFLIERQPSGHKGEFVERKVQVVFAEPGELGSRTGLIPGDRLIGVNGSGVTNLTRDEIIGLIRQSGDSVELRVQPVPELHELSLRPRPLASSAGFCRQDVRDWISKEMSLRGCAAYLAKDSDSPTPTDMTDHGQSESGVRRQDGREEKNGVTHQRVWLMHKDGYSAASLIEKSAEGGRCLVRLEQDGREVEVDEADIAVANATKFDRVENLCLLPYLNESSVVHVLRLRFGSNMVYTYAGPALLSINPMVNLGIYSEKVMHLFRGCRQEDAPPHIFAVGQMALRTLNATRQAQTVCLLGRSGSGKTVAERHIVTYILHAASSHSATPVVPASPNNGASVNRATSVGNRVTIERVQAMWALLEAFTCARTLLNTNASRCARLTTLEFTCNTPSGSPEHNTSGGGGGLTLAGIHVQVLLLERSRVVRRPEGEPTFHVLYQMLAGVGEQARKEYFLSHLDESNLFLTPLQRAEDRQAAQKTWDRITKSAQLLAISDAEWSCICRLLAAIYHLGVAGAVQRSTGGPGAGYFEKPGSGQRAADLLGVDLNELSLAIFHPEEHQQQAGTEGGGAIQGPGMGGASAMELLENFVVGLYAEAVQLLVYLINRTLSATSSGKQAANPGGQTITLLDTPGFQQPGRTAEAKFEDLAYNYVQERLNLVAHEVNFTLQRAKLEQENIHPDWLTDGDQSPAEMVSLLDNAPQYRSSMGGSLRRTPTTLSSGEAGAGGSKGLLWILDEEAVTGGNEETLIKRLLQLQHHHKHTVKDRGRRVLRRVEKSGQLVLNHYMGTQPVTYNIAGWIKACRDYPAGRGAPLLLTQSRLPVLNDLATRVSNLGATMRRGGRISGSAAALYRQKSGCAQLKIQMDYLVDLLRRSGRPHFVYCLLPVRGAGLCDLRDSPLGPQDTTSIIGSSGSSNSATPKTMFDVPLVRAQLRGYQIVPTLRAYKMGYPDNMPFREFRRRFAASLPAGDRPNSPVMDEREAVETVLEKLHLDPSVYKIGLSQIFMRANVAYQLERQRNEGVTDLIIPVQAYCRGYLARKKLDRLKLHHKAILCIQHNAAMYLAMREWPWWRLYARIRPLLSVQRSESERQDAADQLATLRERLERAEKERAFYKADCDRLETKVTELTEELRAEKSAAGHTADLVEAEQETRIQLEHELTDLKARHHAAERRRADLEATLAGMEKAQQQQQLRRLSSSGLGNHVVMNDDEDSGDDLSMERHQALRREMDTLRKQSNAREASLEEERDKMKKQMDKKLSEMTAEADQTQAELQTTRRRLANTQSELGDLKLQLEEALSRSSELERRQKRFDTELARSSAVQREESAIRDRVQRERDEAMGEKFRLERELQDVRADVDLQTERAQRLTAQLNELTTGGGLGEGGQSAELLTLRRSKLDLEQRVRELEEEVDEANAEVDSLRQAKLRAEMAMEKQKVEAAREAEEREAELEQVRSGGQRRARQLEQQLEEERDERQRLLREKREVDRQMADLLAKTPQRDAGLERKMKKEIKKLKVLLRDKDALVEQYRNQPDEKGTVKQLRDQLDEAETAREVALRQKRTAEKEMEDLQFQMEELQKSKQEADDRCSALSREKCDLQSQLEEQEAEVTEVLRKYKAAVAQQSADSTALAGQARELAEMTEERDRTKRQLSEMQSRLEAAQTDQAERTEVIRLSTRVRDLESRLELETTSRVRAQHQVDRLREQMDQGSEERSTLASSEATEREKARRLQRQLREAQDEATEAVQRCQEAERRRAELTSRVEQLQEDLSSAQGDLRLALRRNQELQTTLDEEVAGDSSDYEHDVSLSSGTGDDASSVFSEFDLDRRGMPLRSALCSNGGRSRTQIGGAGVGSVTTDGGSSAGSRSNSREPPHY